MAYKNDFRITKTFEPNNHEDLIVLNPEDEPLTSERLNAIKPDQEQGEDNVDIGTIKAELSKNNLELIGDREKISGGIFGPLFRLTVRDLKTGAEKYILERTFAKTKGISRRFSCSELNDPKDETDFEPRYRSKTNPKQIIIDYLYNEREALTELNGIKGIPQLYGAVDSRSCGSILTEYINGHDLNSLLMAEDKNFTLITQILEQVKETYIQAAKRGYIHNQPIGSTIMVDAKTNQAYLADWYLYCHGTIEGGDNNPLARKYQAGLAEIENLEKAIITGKYPS